MKRIGFLVFILIAACPWGAWPMRIVCTTTIVGDVVGRIVGEEHEITVLLPVDADPHAFEPTPADLVAIARADVVFLNGAELESSLVPLLVNASGRIVGLSDGLDLRRADGGSDGQEGGHSSEGVDPHVWFDPTYVALWVDRIADVLSDLAPGSAFDVRARAEAYRSELSDLDAWIEGQVARIPEGSRTLVTDHDVFGYFASRYGFRQIGTVFPGSSSLSEPSAREIAALEEAIVATGVPVLFVGTTVDRSIADRVAADTGIGIVSLYTGSLSPPDGPAATYLALMRYDVRAIVDGLLEAP